MLSRYSDKINGMTHSRTCVPLCNPQYSVSITDACAEFAFELWAASIVSTALWHWVDASTLHASLFSSGHSPRVVQFPSYYISSFVNNPSFKRKLVQPQISVQWSTHACIRDHCLPELSTLWNATLCNIQEHLQSAQKLECSQLCW